MMTREQMQSAQRDGTRCDEIARYCDRIESREGAFPPLQAQAIVAALDAIRRIVQERVVQIDALFIADEIEDEAERAALVDADRRAA